jgi:hypothetical protein
VDDVRTSKRFPVHLPVRVDGEKQAGPEKASGSTDNISAAGCYLVVDHEYEVGSTMSFEITIPADLIGAPKDMHVKCTGRVMRNETVAPDKTGVACVLDSYEFIREKETGE